MPATPEIPRPEVPQVTEHQEEFIVPETLQQSTGVQVVQKNFKPQFKDDSSQPLMVTPPAKVIQVTPPADEETLKLWAKGSPDSAQTWLGVFWERVREKAIFFGWKILGKGEPNAT